MKYIVNLLSAVLCELQLVRALLKKQNTPDVRDQECHDVDTLTKRVYSSVTGSLVKTE